MKTCILYQNVGGLKNKIEDITDVMSTKRADLFAITETFLKSDDPPSRLPPSLTCIGKSRRKGEYGGGVGFIVKSDSEQLCILDENLLNSKSDDKERLLVLARVDGIKTAVGIVYYPQDNKDRALTDELSYILLDERTTLQNQNLEIMLVGDFNGKCVKKCNLTGKIISDDNMNSYNGKHLNQLLLASG